MSNQVRTLTLVSIILVASIGTLGQSQAQLNQEACNEYKKSDALMQWVKGVEEGDVCSGSIKMKQ